MKLKTWSRIIALACILASAPLAFLTYPWLPATAREFAELQHDPAPWGTPSYHQGRAERLQRVEAALLLYGLGTVCLVGLSAVVAETLPWILELLTWAVTALTALGIAQFEKPIMPGTALAYLIATVYIPAAIAALAAALAIARFGWKIRNSL